MMSKFERFLRRLIGMHVVRATRHPALVCASCQLPLVDDRGLVLASFTVWERGNYPESVERCVCDGCRYKANAFGLGPHWRLIDRFVA